MKAKKHDTRWMVSVALMAAIVILLANTPLGMIQLPIIKATTVHIPVIIGAILLGPSAGAILGAIFGICSLISNTTAPTLLSFAFSPFLSTTGLVGVVKSDLDLGWMPHYDRCDLRMALDLISKTESEFLSFPYHHWFYRFDGKYDICYGQYLSALCRTVCRCQDVARTAVFGLIMGTVTASGIPEAIAAAILVTVITKALLKVVPNLSNASAN